MFLGVEKFFKIRKQRPAHEPNFFGAVTIGHQFVDQRISATGHGRSFLLGRCALFMHLPLPPVGDAGINFGHRHERYEHGDPHFLNRGNEDSLKRHKNIADVLESGFQCDFHGAVRARDGATHVLKQRIILGKPHEKACGHNETSLRIGCHFEKLALLRFKKCAEITVVAVIELIRTRILRHGLAASLFCRKHRPHDAGDIRRIIKIFLTLLEFLHVDQCEIGLSVCHPRLRRWPRVTRALLHNARIRFHGLFLIMTVSRPPLGTAGILLIIGRDDEFTLFIDTVTDIELGIEIRTVVVQLFVILITFGAHLPCVVPSRRGDGDGGNHERLGVVPVVRACDRCMSTTFVDDDSEASLNDIPLVIHDVVRLRMTLIHLVIKCGTPRRAAGCVLRRSIREQSRDCCLFRARASALKCVRRIKTVPLRWTRRAAIVGLGTRTHGCRIFTRDHGCSLGPGIVETLAVLGRRFVHPETPVVRVDVDLADTGDDFHRSVFFDVHIKLHSCEIIIDIVVLIDVARGTVTPRTVGELKITTRTKASGGTTECIRVDAPREIRADLWNRNISTDSGTRHSRIRILIPAATLHTVNVFAQFI